MLSTFIVHLVLTLCLNFAFMSKLSYTYGPKMRLLVFQGDILLSGPSLLFNYQNYYHKHITIVYESLVM